MEQWAARHVPFGKLDGESAVLYVTTNGGLWAPYREEVQTGKLLRLEIGEADVSVLELPAVASGSIVAKFAEKITCLSTWASFTENC
jgi:hypothetical protein